MNIYELKSSCRLERKILSRQKANSPYFRLAAVRKIVERKISTQKLFAEGNPDIVIADEELEEAFQTKAFIRQNLSRMILQQTMPAPNAPYDQLEVLLANFDRTEVASPSSLFDEDTLKELDFICNDNLEEFLFLITCNCPKATLIPVEKRAIAIANCPYCNKREQQSKTTSSLPDYEKIKRPFGSILEAIENYIKEFDQFSLGTDQGIAIVKGHPLETILGVEALHLSQLSRLLQRQVTPLIPQQTQQTQKNCVIFGCEEMAVITIVHDDTQETTPNQATPQGKRKMKRGEKEKKKQKHCNKLCMECAYNQMRIGLGTCVLCRVPVNQLLDIQGDPIDCLP